MTSPLHENRQAVIAKEQEEEEEETASLVSVVVDQDEQVDSSSARMKEAVNSSSSESSSSWDQLELQSTSNNGDQVDEEEEEQSVEEDRSVVVSYGEEEQYDFVETNSDWDEVDAPMSDKEPESNESPSSPEPSLQSSLVDGPVSGPVSGLRRQQSGGVVDDELKSEYSLLWDNNNGNKRNKHSSLSLLRDSILQVMMFSDQAESWDELIGVLAIAEPSQWMKIRHCDDIYDWLLSQVDHPNCNPTVLKLLDGLSTGWGGSTAYFNIDPRVVHALVIWMDRHQPDMDTNLCTVTLLLKRFSGALYLNQYLEGYIPSIVDFALRALHVGIETVDVEAQMLSLSVLVNLLDNDSIGPCKVTAANGDVVTTILLLLETDQGGIGVKRRCLQILVRLSQVVIYQKTIADIFLPKIFSTETDIDADNPGARHTLACYQQILRNVLGDESST